MSASADRSVQAGAEVLFGHDGTSRVVAVQIDGADRPAEQPVARLYRRSKDLTEVASEFRPFYPFLFLDDTAALEDLPRSSYRRSTLQGDDPLNHLVAFTSLEGYWNAERAVRLRSRGATSLRESMYRPGALATQFLMQSGVTLFKDMRFDDLHRMQIDIEVLSSGLFPNSARLEDAIIVVALSDNRGWSEVLHAGETSESELLQEFVNVLRRRDPDVIEGHNILGFDLPYITERCRRTGVRLAIGRDGSEPRRFSSSMRFAERSRDITVFEIAGRHVIDTLLLVLAFDVFKRDMPGYSLKAAARYFGLSAPDRTYVEGDSIGRLWSHDRRRVLAYALDDVLETERLARHLSGATYYLTQMLPMDYGLVARSGPAAKIESLFVREYLHKRHALPAGEWGSQSAGGYTDVFVTGLVGPVVYADVESLYPSIMLQNDVAPQSDALGVFRRALTGLTDLRLQTKKAMSSAATPAERSELDARQNSFKILINSFYGQLGFSGALFNDYSEADRVALEGQRILRSIMAMIEQRGGRVVEVDTDGVLFVPPTEARDESAERAFVDGLNADMPTGIRIGFDGRYRRMLSYKKKNYALLGYDGRVTFKGSALVSRSVERFGRDFVRSAISLLLQDNVPAVHERFLALRRRILERDWTVDEFCKTETLKDRPESYLNAVRSGKRQRSAAYELALRRRATTGEPVRKGDRIQYYISGSDDAEALHERARLASEYDPSAPDENTAFYLRRLSEFASRFEVFFDRVGFEAVFPTRDAAQTSLFGIPLEQVRIRTRVHDRS